VCYRASKGEPSTAKGSLRDPAGGDVARFALFLFEWRDLSNTLGQDAKAFAGGGNFYRVGGARFAGGLTR